MYEWRRFIIATLIVFIQLFIVETTFGAQNSSQCTIKCTEGDGSVICWESIMDYFTVDLQRALTNYVTAVGHVSQWKHHHDKDEVIAKHDFVVRSLERTLSGNGPLSRDNLIAVFSVVLNMTSVDQLRQRNPTTEIPPLICPIPCDYYPKMWASLFFITLAAFALCCLAFVIHLCWNEQLKATMRRDGLIYRPA